MTRTATPETDEGQYSVSWHDKYGDHTTEHLTLDQANAEHDRRSHMLGHLRVRIVAEERAR